MSIGAGADFIGADHYPFASRAEVVTTIASAHESFALSNERSR
jgi:hypothetical protein